MKQTIKQWCADEGVNWLGQGSSGGIRYDWKLVLGKGRTAIFSTIVEGPLPETRRIGKRDVLVFPNVNRSRDGGKISKAAFIRIINWVEDCLGGNVRKLESPNTNLEPFQKVEYNFLKRFRSTLEEGERPNESTGTQRQPP